MKKLVYVALMLGACAPSGKQEAGDRKAILKVLDEQMHAWNQGNLEAYMQGYWQSDSLMFTSSQGIQHGWQQTLQRYKSSYPTTEVMGQLRFEILQLTPTSCDSYFLTGRYHLSRSVGNLSGIFTLVWRKIDHRWVIIYDQTC
jgi:hypothetical protein